MNNHLPLMFNFDNTYSKLPNAFYQKVNPTPVTDPKLILFNLKLANQLAGSAPSANDAELFNCEDLKYLIFKDLSKLELAQIFSGNKILEGSIPLAQAYAGHQFGHFVPQLGDGRAILLGEVLVSEKRYDIQLKGSGLTAFSRGGDGRAPLGPMIREYIVSEAMHALGIPTTRSLALVASGDTVVRDKILPGGILTRVAASHIRVGTFEYFASRYDLKNLKSLADYTIQRHFPEAIKSENSYLELLKLVIQKQASLIAQWMSVGFVHGVMNTDNMTVSGETIDYGPCAFIDYYKSDAVFSSIDKRGRYAFSNQAPIAKWNLSVFASCLIPLIAHQKNDPTKSFDEISEANEAYSNDVIEMVQAEIDAFDQIYEDFWLQNMKKKFGLNISGPNTTTSIEQEKNLIRTFLKILEEQNIDFTLAFRLLSDVNIQDLHETKFYQMFYSKDSIEEWVKSWKAYLSLEETSGEDVKILMDKTNPSFIPRSHLIAKVIEKAEQGEFESLNELRLVLNKPFENPDSNLPYFNPPKNEERVTRTFCGT